MSTTKILLAAVLFIGLSNSETWADCNISDSKIEEAILQKPEFRDPLNRQLFGICVACGTPLSFSGLMGELKIASALWAISANS
jgi:hypothetical protein